MRTAWNDTIATVQQTETRYLSDFGFVEKVTHEFSVIEDDQGDGAVPLISSTMNGNIKDHNRLYYVVEGHSTLAQNSDVIGLIKSKIDNWENLEGSRFGFAESKIAHTMKA